MVGILDLSTSSNSDVGLSGAFTPYVKVYDKYYFTPETEPCMGRFNFDKSLMDGGFYPRSYLTEDKNGGYVENIIPDNEIFSTDDFESYLHDLNTKSSFEEYLRYEPILIVEKEEIL